MARLRATVTAIAMSFVVGTLGLFAFLCGLVYPSRRLMDWSARVWAKAILFFSGVQLTVVGREYVDDGESRFFMGNHQSALDIPIIIDALGGHVRFLAKDTLFRIPIFGWVLRRYGYVPVNRSRARVTLVRLNRMLASLKRRPISYAVFPEGTRSPDGRLLPFRRGTMKIAQRSGLAVVPFAIDGSMKVYHRDRFEARPGPVRMVFCSPIPFSEAARMTPDGLRDRVVGAVASALASQGESTRSSLQPRVVA